MFVLLLMAAAAAPQAPLAAAPGAAPTTGSAEDAAFTNQVHVAEHLIDAGRLDEAHTLLTALEKARPRHSQVQFLLALIDRHDKNYYGAIRRFRAILVDEPKAVRVRLELGRTFFEAGDYVNAERQFRFARAGGLPEPVVLNIDRFLGAIRQRKTFSYGFLFALAPDSNVNAGPATDTITLYGLPFELDPNAKRHSGVGLIVAGNVEYAPRLSDRAKLLLGAQLYRAQYRDNDFSDMTIATYAGPRVNLRRWEFNLQGRAARRWYGGRVYVDQIGGGADATHYLNRRLGVGVALNFSRINYKLNPQQSGWTVSTGLNTSYALTPASFVRGTVQLGRQTARADAYANRSWLVRLEYVRELKGGFTLEVAGGFTRISYDEPLAVFGTTRKDKQYTGQISLLNRRIDLYGLTPRIGYTIIRNESSISLYEFSRNRLEFGFTGAF